MAELGYGERLIAERARARLGDNGEHWQKGSTGAWHSAEQGVCAIGALYFTVRMILNDDGYDAVAQISPVAEEMARIIIDRYPERLVMNVPDSEPRMWEGIIPTFNDDPRTTWEDVSLVFKETESRCG